MKNNKNLPLILGLAIPVFMTLFIVACVYIPKLFSVKPTTDFIYANTRSAYTTFDYIVQNGKIAKRDRSHDKNIIDPVADPQLYYHDVQTNKSREISFEEALNFKLDQSKLSSDGCEVVRGSGGDGFFPFFYYSSNYHNVYIKGSGFSQKLNLMATHSPYYYEFQFIAWVVNP